MGAADIFAADIDPNSVAATKETLARYAPNARSHAEVKSIFDFSPERDGQFDVVYSWGVLHHTGDMWRAIRIAASMAKPGGLFAVALYRKTPMCGFWTQEKKIYSKAPRLVQATMRVPYKALWIAQEYFRLSGKPFEQIRNWRSRRGMSWSHDVHDWLGGYPYKSATAESVRTFLDSLGFDIVREFAKPPDFGLRGTGCDEFVAKRRASS